MKQLKIYMTFLGLFLALGAMAQFTYGPKLGLNLANQSGENIENENTKMIVGFNVGVVGNYSFTEMFSAQAEVLYDTKGTKYEYTAMGGQTETTKLNLGYINIPIMFVATFGDDLKFFGEVGPTIGILTSAKYDGEKEFEMPVYDPEQPWLPPTTETVKYKDWYKSTDVGLVIGAGVGLPLADKVCKVDLRYNFSLGTIHAEPEGSSGDNQETIKNGVISINATLLFGGA